MMKRLIGTFEILTAFAAVGACARGPDARLPRVSTVSVSHMIPAGQGVNLEVVDWGARGQDARIYGLASSYE